MEFTNTFGHKISLLEKLDKGGEGAIYKIAGQSNCIAKVYFNKPSRLLHEKLEAMLLTPPREPNKGHVSVAWPTDCLFDRTSDLVGYIMPYIPKEGGADKIYNFEEPNQRKKLHPNFSRRHAYHAGCNLSSAVSLVHHAGHVVGDLNESNILCNEDGMVTLIDTDSFQVTSKVKLFRCGVAKDEWVAPEIQGIQRGTFDWEPAHDHFALAIHVFQLLFGFHPFNGVLKNNQAVRQVHVHLIAKRIFPYVSNQFADPPPGADSLFKSLSVDMQNAFVQTFHDGGSNPGRRLLPHDWIRLLATERDSLKQCPTCVNWIEASLSQCLTCRRQHSSRVGSQSPIAAPVTRQRPLTRAPANKVKTGSVALGRMFHQFRRPFIITILLGMIAWPLLRSAKNYFSSDKRGISHLYSQIREDTPFGRAWKRLVDMGTQIAVEDRIPDTAALSLAIQDVLMYSASNAQWNQEWAAVQPGGDGAKPLNFALTLGRLTSNWKTKKPSQFDQDVLIDVLRTQLEKRR